MQMGNKASADERPTSAQRQQALAEANPMGQIFAQLQAPSLEECVRLYHGASRNKARALIRQGAVSIDGAVVYDRVSIVERGSTMMIEEDDGASIYEIRQPEAARPPAPAPAPAPAPPPPPPPPPVSASRVLAVHARPAQAPAEPVEQLTQSQIRQRNAERRRQIEASKREAAAERSRQLQADLERMEQALSAAPEQVARELRERDKQLREAHLTNEYVLLDVRLEMVGLNRIDEVCEVRADLLNDESSVALPLADEMLEKLTWVRDETGFMIIPSDEPAPQTHDANELLRIPNEWWQGLRYHCDSIMRTELRFQDMPEHYRVFVLPLPAEQCVRLVLTLDSRRLTPAVLYTNTRTARVLAHYLASPDVGEWPSTRPRVFRTTRGAALLEAASGVPMTPQAFTPRVPHERTFEQALREGAVAEAGPAEPAVVPPAILARLGADAPPAASESGNARAAPAGASASVTPQPRGKPASLSIAIPVNEARAAPSLSTPLSLRAGVDSSLAGFGTPRTPAGLMLYPHQRRTVSWMLQREAFAATPAELQVKYAPVREFSLARHRERLLRADADGFFSATRPPTEKELEPFVFSLPSGGIVAHPVGAGKTVISAALLGKTQGRGMTIVTIPGHLASQWQGELLRFVPNLRVEIVHTPQDLAKQHTAGVDVLLLPHGAVSLEAVRTYISKHEFHRLIIDEPQDILAHPHHDFFVKGFRTRHRWLLTATPTPLGPVLQLAWGAEGEDVPLDSLRHEYVRSCGIRDSPQDCLPVPPLRTVMLPVALTWQETSIVHMRALAGHMQASIQLSSYFANVDEAGNVAEAAVARAPAERGKPDSFDSLDAWVTSHRQEIEARVAKLTARLNYLSLAIEEHVVRARQERAQRAAAAAAADASRPQMTRQQLEVEVARRHAALPKGPVVRLVPVDLDTRRPLADRAPTELALPRAWEVDDEDQQEALFADFVADVWDEYRMRVRHVFTPGSLQPVTTCLAAAQLGVLEIVLVPSPRTDWQLRAERKFKRMCEEVGLDENSMRRDDRELFDAAAGVPQELLVERETKEGEMTNAQHLLAFMNTVADALRNEDAECTVCMEELQGQVVTILPCLHAFCAGCVVRMFDTGMSAPCPMCRTVTQRRSLCTFRCVTAQPEPEPEPESDSQTATATAEATASTLTGKFRGSKIAALVSQLRRIFREHRDDKILIFAQWTPLLQQISEALAENDIAHLSLTGSSMESRADTLEHFRREAEPRVMLLSYESHASGANLDVASHCFIVHPYCPPNVMSSNVIPLTLAQAFERQAVGRVHRFPQKKIVYVYRLYARGTVEEDLYHAWGWIQ